MNTNKYVLVRYLDGEWELFSKKILSYESASEIYQSLFSKLNNENIIWKLPLADCDSCNECGKWFNNEIAYRFRKNRICVNNVYCSDCANMINPNLNEVITLFGIRPTKYDKYLETKLNAKELSYVQRLIGIKVIEYFRANDKEYLEMEVFNSIYKRIIETIEFRRK